VSTTFFSVASKEDMRWHVALAPSTWVLGGGFSKVTKVVYGLAAADGDPVLMARKAKPIWLNGQKRKKAGGLWELDFRGAACRLRTGGNELSLVLKVHLRNSEAQMAMKKITIYNPTIEELLSKEHA
jgi:hypothetical protein